ncbi:MAG: phosphoribosylglycinamide formyltransferase [Chloroflexota bacterium]
MDPDKGQRLQVAVFLSGSGRTLENLLAYRKRDRLDIDIPVVISSRPNVRGVEIARNAGIETHIITKRSAPAPSELSRRVKEAIAHHRIDLFVLAGYLLRLDVLPEWEWRIIIVHPSLLPLFGGRGMYGNNVHRAVLESGMKVSGATVHFVNQDYDAGPIIMQECVPVEPGDTEDELAARVFDLETRLYPRAIQLFAEGRIQVVGDRVQVLARST